MEKADKFFDWLEEQWDFKEWIQLGIEAYNKTHEGSYNINYPQFRQMASNKLEEIYGNVSFGGFNQPYPFKDESEST